MVDQGNIEDAPRPRWGSSAVQTESEFSLDESTRKRRGVIAVIVLAVLSVAMFIGAKALDAAKSGPEVSDSQAQRIFELRSQIQQAQSQKATLPLASDAARSLVTAFQASTSVAALQNNYRMVAGEVAKSDGKLDEASIYDTYQGMTPYFAQGSPGTTFEPWYLLRSDAQVPVGTGLPVDFNSGFSWVAQPAHTINDSGSVTVTWLAIETRPSAGSKPRLLAWAQADYDVQRRVFGKLTLGLTELGQSLQLEVAR